MAGLAQKLHLKKAQPGYQPGNFGYQRQPADQKALRFEQKAAQYEAQGNLTKAQKNREKALRHRSRTQPGYATPTVPEDRHTRKLAKLEQKALAYEQKGNINKANRSRQRANRLRTKYGLPMTAGALGGVPLMAGQPGFAGAPLGQPVMMQQGMQTNMMQTNMMQTGMVGVQHETIVKPAIVQETIRTDRIVEVQPVIHREVDQSIVHHIEKHITEAPAPNMGGVVQMAPIVQETIRPQVIDEITPVIHRTVATTQVERVEEHIGERIVAPTQHTNQVVFDNQGLVGGQMMGGMRPGVVSGYNAGSFGYPRLGREQKALRFEQKAQQYQAAGNLAKAQRNREKAQRHRQYLQPGFQSPAVNPQQRMEKLARLEQRAALQNQRGNPQKANLYNQRANRLRAKYGLQQGGMGQAGLAGRPL